MNELNKINQTKNIGLFAVMMLIIGAIDSIRNLPATALFGSALIFFFVFSAITFLIPTALVSAELSARHSKQGGLYHWTKSAFGHKAAFFAVWLQWINTMVWYPTILSFIAGTATYLLDPKLAQNKFYLISVILGVFWFLTFINLKGVKASAKFNSFCAVAGTVLPMALIVILGVVWITMGKHLNIHFTENDIFPSLTHTNSWISLTAIMTAFLGMELTAVHVNHMKDPQKTFPKAMLFSVMIILFTMLFGALSIAFVLPANQINLVNGVLQAFTAFFAAYHIAWLMPVITVLILVGSLGGMINWIISPSKGLLQAAQDGYLPEFLQKENKYGAAKNLLLLQAVLVSIICLAFLLMPSVNGSYWLLSDLSTQLYICMYVILFIVAIVTRYKFSHEPKSAFMIPGGFSGLWITCILGLTGCIITLIVGFFPPDGINVGGTAHYELVFSAGIIAMVLPSLCFYWYKNKQEINLITSEA